MHRPVSPLLHDYKPPEQGQPKKSRALQWFIVGLGIPLLGLALISTVDQTNQATPTSSMPEMTATGDAGSPVAEPKVFAEVPLVLAPEPDYETLLLKIKRGDTLDRLFRANDLDLGHLAQVARLEEARKQFRKIKPGDIFEITHDDGKLVRMYSVLNLTSALQVDRDDAGFSAQIVERPIEIRKRMAHGVINSSLYESAAEAGLSDKLIMNVAGIFAWDVDFVLDIRGGDNYYVHWEEIWQDGEFVTDGAVIAAEFNNDGRQYQAIRFVDETGRSDYFTPEGNSVRKAFLRAPVDFRVSSSFNPNRLHPVLKTRRPHRGVDYAAPSGTPIKAAGDGKVIYRGVKSGYGNVVILQHGGNITTLYAHMSRFASSVRAGSRVRQGQTIGYVGATGLVTGAHLHYEYRLNGVHRNPRTVKLPKAEPIAARYRDEFLAQAKPILEELEQFKSTQRLAVAYAD
ncbi:MAG: peptidoglycan DD-metalloendopeptidase family protein [Woeseiaceae bacterium]|nr:peptidoglycan DD-metalloendopeptidase family protein [Woeseiaceae bacterium]NIP20441.1 peptidoglycan DD-metalloendopeptidase family protein [Woeseiaceae bacterium]NIS89036.1 peptidoglycan DD-metalloendopeptidase family protein [Woeseiaceae bacterium]